jgi:hypothetical protein
MFCFGNAAIYSVLPQMKILVSVSDKCLDGTGNQARATCVASFGTKYLAIHFLLTNLCGTHEVEQITQLFTTYNY